MICIKRLMVFARNIHLYWHTHKHAGNDSQEIQILIRKGLTCGLCMVGETKKFPFKIVGTNRTLYELLRREMRGDK